MTSDKGMGITSGQTIEGSRGGGTKTSNMALESTLALNRQLQSLEYGRWENELNGSLSSNVSRSEQDSLTILTSSQFLTFKQVTRMLS